MNRPNDKNSTVRLPDQDEIDRVRQQFETAWRAGLKNGRLPEVDAFLRMIAEPLHATLRQELTRVDHEYRQRLGNARRALEPPADPAATIDRSDDAAQEASHLPLSPTAGGEGRIRGAAAGGTLDYVPDTNDDGKSPPTSTAPTDSTLDYPSPRPADSGATVDGAALMRNLNNASFELARGIEAAPAREPGSVAGYEILEVLGRGAMGVVYKARQRGLKRIVALKMILAGDHVGEAELARFRTEAEAAGQLQHPNIVQVYEVGEQGGCPFLSLEYINGGSLKDRLGGKPQPVLHAAQLVQVLAQTMDFAHRQGIIHRDLKPGNVMLVDARASRSSESTLSIAPLVEELYGIPKIADFGLAKRLEEDKGQTRSGTILGTPSYMAPEQAEGRSKEVGPLADQYSLGAMLYELLTGRPPFQGATVWETLDQVRSQEPVPPSQLQPKVPRDLETICLKALQKEPHKRYATTGAMAEDLRRFLANEPILARPVSNAERLRRWCVRNPRVAALLGAVSLLLVLITAGSLLAAWKISKEKARAEEQTILAENNAQEAQQNAHTAELNAERAKEEEELAGKQAVNAMELAYDVIVKADEYLKDKAEMGPFRKQLLDSAMKRLNNISRALVDSGKADRTMAAAMQRMGMFYEQSGRSGDAIRAYQDALQVFERLIRENPDEDRNRSNAAICYDNLGEIGREVERDPAVLFDHYRKALELRQALVAQIRNPEITAAERHWYLGVSFNKLGTLCLIVGDPAQGDSLLHKALEQYQAATEADPTNGKAKRLYLSETYYLLGKACAHLGQPEAARRYLEQSRKLREELTIAEPLNVDAKKFLAATDDARGDLELESGKLEQALAYYQKGHDLCDSLCREDKGNPELQWYRSNSDYHLATVQALLRNEAAAQRALRACALTRQALLKADPTNAQRKIELMLVLARLGQHQEASRLAYEVRSYAPHHPGMLVAVTCCYALCIPDTKDAAQQKSYADQAASALSQAITDGYRDAVVLEQSPDLKPLRAFPAYKILLGQVATRK
jgi:serine/threonine-protein kinase